MAKNGRRLAWMAGFVLLFSLTLAGCGTIESVRVEDEEPGVRTMGAKQTAPDKGRSYNIPPEYMPPPGKCRIWFPGRPPEHQPPPGECADLQRHVPLNTWLLRGAKE
jgi:hypothetical protein